jgi:hypothetical protein
MDLALELGFRTVEALRREMTEEELGQWYRYASRKKLPMRRIELLLANLARLTAGVGRDRAVRVRRIAAGSADA